MKASIRELWSREVARLRNHPFLEAAMAAGALVSTADGVVRLSEQLALDAWIARIERLQVFDEHAGVNLHRDYVEGIQADTVKGRRRALDRVATFRGRPKEGRLILYVAAGIARADLELSDSEVTALEDICSALDLDAAETLAGIFGEGEAQDP